MLDLLLSFFTFLSTLAIAIGFIAEIGLDLLG